MIKRTETNERRLGEATRQDIGQVHDGAVRSLPDCRRRSEGRQSGEMSGEGDFRKAALHNSLYVTTLRIYMLCVVF